jgi:hypothetical protein
MGAMMRPDRPEGGAMKRIVVVAVALAVAGPGYAAPSVNDPAELIRTLYGASAHDSGRDPLWWSYLTGAAQTTFARVQRAERQSGDELVDADFLCQCQDTENMRVLSIVLTRQTPAAVRARVAFTNFGHRQSMVFDLANAGHGWKIAEMTTGDGHTFSGENIRALKEAGK